MFINLTNHPSEKWGEEQLKAARQYGEIVDIPFPVVEENATEPEIRKLADVYFDKIMSEGKSHDLTVHIMGEQTLCYALISKLQKKGIRCVASCTKSDSFYNEAGQKVSTFHFSRFREYYPINTISPTLANEEGKWKQIEEILKTKTFYSIVALIFIIMGETFVLCGLRLGWCRWTPWTLAVVALLIGLWLLARFYQNHFDFKSRILSKLLANSIAPTRLGTFYLLFFVVHLGWLTNVAMNMFLPSCDFGEIIWATIICVIGMLVLILFFPEGRENKAKNAKFVFVTGISSYKGVPMNNNEEEPTPPSYIGFNMRPLIRILQKVTQQKDFINLKGEFLILQTSDFSSAIPTPFFDGYKDFGFDTINYQECEKYGITPENALHDKLRLIIKKIAIKEFPTMEEWIKNNLDIEFTLPCNYNDFPTCFKTLSKIVQDLDDSNHRFIFNTTPGTAVVSTVMTLLSIDADRELYYYSQDSSIPEARISERLQKADKQGIQLEGLLSQALEKMTSNK